MAETAFFNQYKGIFFRYQPVKDPVAWGFTGLWILSDSENGWGICQDFNADEMRLDQCFNMFKETLEKIVPATITYIQHVAGVYEDGLQLCRYCGKILIDHTGSWATTDPTGNPGSWTEGETISQSGGFTMVGTPPLSAPNERIQRVIKKCIE